ncbi:response regulator transcription factor [Hutsoniella sourekii]|uniref:response regulator transcription factor n=1 Tax=Hutsoniella sourekii TaxID=87650 RepID=UPI000486CB08|nr:response regulator transcription factor [Hutsoniella sourekii]
MYEILIIEDDVAIQGLIGAILEQEGNYQVKSAYSGTEAILLLEKNHFDLMILDLMLPGKNGRQVLEEIKGQYQGGVIVVSAVSELEDKVHLLKLGADDYMTKPFHQDELLARIESVLRRYGHSPDKDASPEENQTFKDLTLNTKKHNVSLQGQELNLTATEFAILQVLMSQPQEVFTKDRLYQLVWDDDQAIEDNSINVHISNLRKKIAAIVGSDPYIQTVWGIGFKLADESL